MPLYVIAYDISNPKRLRRVARFLERRAVRVQYSVFAFRGDSTSLAGLMEEIGKLILAREDVVQAWPIPPGVPLEQFALGQVRPVNSAAVVIANTTRFVTRPIPTPSPTSTTGDS